jgi:predicted ribosome quality control (RQC) complex YloA/Tae2 family protein
MPFDPSSLRDAPAVWAYTLDGDWLVWAGRTSTDNDKLSLKVARNDDWWFHVKGTPGSHVVLFVRDGVEPPRAALDAAAAIAAYHSKMRDGGLVPVSACRARDVSKPRGAPAGLVEIHRETTIKVRPALPAGAAPPPAPPAPAPGGPKKKGGGGGGGGGRRP